MRYGRSPPPKYSTQFTPFSCPSSVKLGVGCPTDHTFTVRSSDADANVLVSLGLNAACMT